MNILETFWLQSKLCRQHISCLHFRCVKGFHHDLGQCPVWFMWTSTNLTSNGTFATFSLTLSKLSKTEVRSYWFLICWKGHDKNKLPKQMKSREKCSLFWYFFDSSDKVDCVLQIFDMVHIKRLEIHPNIVGFPLVYGNMIGCLKRPFFPWEHVIDMLASISYIFDIRIWNYPSLAPLHIAILLLLHFFMEITFSLENFKWDILLYIFFIWYLSDKKWKKKNEEKTGENKKLNHLMYLTSVQYPKCILI